MKQYNSFCSIDVIDGCPVVTILRTPAIEIIKTITLFNDSILPKTWVTTAFKEGLVITVKIGGGTVTFNAHKMASPEEIEAYISADLSKIYKKPCEFKYAKD